MKKFFLSLFVVLTLFLGFQCAGQQTVYAEGTAVYLDNDCNVSVLKVYRKSDVNIDTDVEFLFFKRMYSDTTHYEFLKKDGTWIFRPHKIEYGHWQPVEHNEIARAIFDYAYYND